MRAHLIFSRTWPRDRRRAGSRPRRAAPWLSRGALPAVAALIMAVPLAQAGQVGQAATGRHMPAPPVQRMRPVPGRPVPVLPRPADPAARAAVRQIPAPAWPAPGRAVAVLAAPAPAGAAPRGRWASSALAAPSASDAPVQAGGLPVWIGAARPARPDAAATPAPGSVAVSIASRAEVSALGLHGVLFTLERADGTSAGTQVSVRLGYAGFRQAYGGDWASRLRLFALPPCALSTPSRPACRSATPVPGRNDTAAGTVSADVQVAGSAGTVYALDAAASGAAGSFTATSLAPSAAWEAGGPSGDFNWSYSLTPPPAQGVQPKISFSYDSGSIDGRTGESNNQPSWVGEGWDYWPGYVERTYRPCADDIVGGTPATGDLCWATNNATLNLDGHTTQLVRDDATGVWRAQADDGDRVEQLAGAANGIYDGAYWRITTNDGTQYYFGLDKLPNWQQGDTDTQSAWTVPVFGNNAGEPCHAATFDASWCMQGWRWNLDYVVDPHHNTLAYYYQPELNYYGRDMDPAKSTAYTRGGYLLRAEYGTTYGTEYSAPAPDRILFTVAERCLPSGTITCDPSQLTSATAASWPDVPYDQNCAAGASCAMHSPTFWTRKRLTQVTSQVYTGGAYQAADTWVLTQLFPSPGDGTSPGLWLSSIQRTGDAGGTASLPPVTFNGFTYQNRVDPSDGQPPLAKWRISSILNETGGETALTYSAPQCSVSPTVVMPASPDSNTLRCFPEWRADLNRFDWFNKFVITQVTEKDLTGGSPAKVTSYSYLGNAAWHYDDSELVKPAQRTWSQWRGYGQVQVITGNLGQQQSEVDNTYFRGMDGDRLSSGATRSVSVTDSLGESVADNWRLDGYLREQVIRDGPGGPEVSGTINDPWLHGPAATRRRSADGLPPLSAYLLDTAATRSRTDLASGGVRRTEVDTTFNDSGLPVAVSDQGDTSTTADDLCTRITYAPNTQAWMLDYPVRTETVSVACPVTPSYPADAVADVRTYYDGATTFGTPPVTGDPTWTERLASYSGGSPVYVTKQRVSYDAEGRVTASYDALGNKTATAYTPALGGPVTQTVVTNPMGFANTTALDPLRGQATSATDANGKVTSMTYDPLGRLSAAWLPDRPKSAGASPSVSFSYLLRTDGPVAVGTSTLTDDGTGYVTKYQIYDGLLRPRQAQAPSPDGGAVITETQYDTRGLAVKHRDPFYGSAPPGTSLLGVADTDVPGQTVTTYDGASRPVAAAFQVHGTEQWRTSTAYGGDHTDLTPPAGGTATSTYTDARGRTTQLRQYHAATPSGAYDATSYTYTPDGKQAAMTDPAGNTWSYHYDLRGRQVSASDPDRGTTTSSYDDLDQLTATTDSRGQTIAYTYDSMGRKTAQYADPVSADPASGTLQIRWTYDTLEKGQPTASARYVNGSAYTAAVTGYDDRYRPTGTSVTIPAAEGALAGTYTSAATYTPGGNVSSTTLPAAGGLAAETLRYTYDSLGDPLTLAGRSTYVTSTLYNPLGQVSQVKMQAASYPATWSTYNYQDGTQRLSEIATDIEATPSRISDLNYSYDPAGDVTSIADTPASGAADIQCFSYDYLRRLTEAWTPASGCAGAPGGGPLAGPAPYWQSFRYDLVGDRTAEVQHSITGGTDTTETYTYPAPGTPQPHTLRSVTTTGPSGSHTDTYGYDSTGAMVSRNVAGTAQTMTQDTEGNVAAVTQGGRQSTYIYDASGNRLIDHDPAGATLYLPGQDIRYDTASATVTASRYYAIGAKMVGVRTGGGLQWLADDKLGTAQLAIDATTAAVTQRRFTPFGEPRGGGTPGSFPGDRGYIGGTADPVSGLVHLGARDYDPATGRFTSVDPALDIADPQQANGYAYSDNNPVTFADPTGKMLAMDDGSGASGGAGTAAQADDVAARQEATTERAAPAHHSRGSVYRGRTGHFTTKTMRHGTIVTYDGDVVIAINGVAMLRFPNADRFAELVDEHTEDVQRETGYHYAVLPPDETIVILLQECSRSARSWCGGDMTDLFEAHAMILAPDTDVMGDFRSGFGTEQLDAAKPGSAAAKGEIPSKWQRAMETTGKTMETTTDTNGDYISHAVGWIPTEGGLPDIGSWDYGKSNAWVAGVVRIRRPVYVNRYDEYYDTSENGSWQPKPSAAQYLMLLHGGYYRDPWNLPGNIMTAP